MIEQYRKTAFLAQKTSLRKHWLLAVMRCLDQLPIYFSLKEVYAFVPILAEQFPDNHHIEAKIRQQLQLLRDQGLLLFLGDGKYQKIDSQGRDGNGDT